MFRGWFRSSSDLAPTDVCSDSGDQPEPPRKHVVIVGGGIAGVSTAYFLRKLAGTQQSNLDITILERSSALHDGGASRYNGGIICPSVLRHWASPSFLLTGLKSCGSNFVSFFTTTSGAQNHQPVWVDKRCWLDPDWYRFGAHFVFASLFRNRENTEKMGIISEHATRIWRDLLEDRKQHPFAADPELRRRWAGSGPGHPTDGLQTSPPFRGMIFTNVSAGLRGFLAGRTGDPASKGDWQTAAERRLHKMFESRDINSSETLMEMLPQVREELFGGQGGILFTEKSEGVGDIGEFGRAMADSTKDLKTLYGAEVVGATIDTDTEKNQSVVKSVILKNGTQITADVFVFAQGAELGGFLKRHRLGKVPSYCCKGYIADYRYSGPPMEYAVYDKDVVMCPLTIKSSGSSKPEQRIRCSYGLGFTPLTPAGSSPSTPSGSTMLHPSSTTTSSTTGSSSEGSSSAASAASAVREISADKNAAPASEDSPTRIAHGHFHPHELAAALTTTVEEKILHHQKIHPERVDAAACLRPMVADDVPVVGPLRSAGNAFVLGGLGSKGWTLGPGCGVLMATMVADRLEIGDEKLKRKWVPEYLDVRGFSPDRFYWFRGGRGVVAGGNSYNL